jgi:hypothetical protein
VADQGNEFAFGHIQVDVAKRGEVAFSRFKGLGNALNL